MSFNFGLPSSAVMAQIGYNMGADLVARLEEARQQRDIQAALSHSEALVRDLWQQNEQLRNDFNTLVNDYNKLLAKNKENSGLAKTALADFRQISETLASERAQAQAYKEHAERRADRLEETGHGYLARARVNGAKAFALNFMLKQLAAEVKRCGDTAKYETLKPEWQTRAGSWAHVVFINTNLLKHSDHFPIPGTETPAVLNGFDWTAMSPAKKNWHPARINQLAKLEALPEVLSAAVALPDTFDAICSTVAPPAKLAQSALTTT